MISPVCSENNIHQDKLSTEEIEAAVVKRQQAVKEKHDAAESSEKGHKEDSWCDEDSARLCQVKGLRVLGHTTAHEIVFWQNGRIKFFPARAIQKDDLGLLLGEDGREHKDKVKEYIVNLAHKVGTIDLTTPRRQGLWKINGKWLLNSGRRGIQIEEGKITILESPVFEGQFLEFGEKEFLDVEEFRRAYFDEKLTLLNVFNEVNDLAMQWNWAESTMPCYATSLVMLTPFQYVLSWRPWIYILGPTHSGKTKFFESVLESIFLYLAKRFDKTTAHALAQGIGNTGSVTILDEQDKNANIEQVLELLKASCRGGTKTSGTPGTKANKYDLHHMVWLGGIYYPATIREDAAKQNRIILLELNPVKTRGVVREAEKDGKLAARILAILLREWDRISEKAKEIFASRGKETSPQGSDRTYENFQFPSALLSIIHGKEYTIPEWTTPTVESDENRLLKTILSSPVEIQLSERKEKRTIAEVLDYIERKEYIRDSKECLGRVGVSMVMNSGDPYLAIETDSLRRQVLKDTSYNGADISGILKRVSGAKSDVAKIGGSSVRAILIPAEALSPLLGRDEVTSP